jgi:hypothetical protein
MADLRKVVLGLGYTDVATYIQSGSVVFTSEEADTAMIAAALERAIAEHLGVRPIRFGGTRTFEAIPGGTRITFSGGGRAGGFFGLAEPLLLRAAQWSLRSDLASLKRLLEGQPQD